MTSAPGRFAFPFFRSASVLAAIAVSALSPRPVSAQPDPATRERAAMSLEKGVDYLRREVAVEGGYLWRYSADLAVREGEGKADAQTAWVQPPGTPSLGDAFLQAYRRTGETYLLEAARETAAALLAGQLQSGGWDYKIYFDQPRRAKQAYRRGGAAEGGANVTTLDDNTTQAAVQFLMRLDQTLKFEDAAVHEAAAFALEQLLRAQYPNGAWPQRYSEFPRPEDFPVLPASYPQTWPRTYPGKDYRGYYTLNDNTLADMIGVFLDAAEIYDEPRYREAAVRGGEFLLRAQMPHPQPAWAQQYDAQMHPAWARKFEPPAVTGGESQRAMRILMTLYRRTGDDRFLEPVPRALAYLRDSQLDDGRLARFYELQTNRPLFFTRDYELTYSADNVPTHYGFIVSSALDDLEREYQALQERTPRIEGIRPERLSWSRSLEREAQRVMDAQDANGAWREAGSLADGETQPILNMQTAARNLDVLSRYLGATK